MIPKLEPIPNSWMCPVCLEDFDDEYDCQECITAHPHCQWCGDQYDPEQSMAQEQERFCSEKCEREDERNMNSHEAID